MVVIEYRNEDGEIVGSFEVPDGVVANKENGGFVSDKIKDKGKEKGKENDKEKEKEEEDREPRVRELISYIASGNEKAFDDFFRDPKNACDAALKNHRTDFEGGKYTPLGLACYYGNLHMVDSFLKMRGVETEHDPPLMKIAFTQRRTKTIDLLMSWYLRIKKSEFDLLSNACEAGRFNIVGMIAKRRYQSIGGMIDDKDSILVSAMRRGDMKLVGRLLEFVPDVNEGLGKEGTYFELACKLHNEALYTLLSKRKDFHFGMRRCSFDTRPKDMLEICAFHGEVGIAKMVLDDTRYDVSHQAQSLRFLSYALEKESWGFMRLYAASNRFPDKLARRYDTFKLIVEFMQGLENRVFAESGGGELLSPMCPEWDNTGNPVESAVFELITSVGFNLWALRSKDSNLVQYLSYQRSTNGNFLLSKLIEVFPHCFNEPNKITGRPFLFDLIKNSNPEKFRVALLRPEIMTSVIDNHGRSLLDVAAAHHDDCYLEMLLHRNDLLIRDCPENFMVCLLQQGEERKGELEMAMRIMGNELSIKLLQQPTTNLSMEEIIKMKAEADSKFTYRQKSLYLLCERELGLPVDPTLHGIQETTHNISDFDPEMVSKTKDLVRIWHTRL